MTGAAVTIGGAPEYAWEVGNDTHMIWGGFVGSPAAFKGTFGEDGTIGSVRWTCPGDP